MHRFARENPPRKGHSPGPGFLISIVTAPGKKPQIKLIEEEDVPYHALQRLASERLKQARG
jgi:hypothetical protein